MTKVFLGGTCNESTWRNELKPQLRVEFFDPVVDDWNEEAQEREIVERENADLVLYVITPKMTGVYSIAEVIDDSNKRPEKTVFCFLHGDDGRYFDIRQIRSLNAVARMVKHNGGKVFQDLYSVAKYINAKGG
jgi:hypothetical protein